MDILTVTDTFKQKIEDAVTMVHAMDEREQVRAIQHWNAVSEQLQEIVNRSVHCTQEMIVDSSLNSTVADISGTLNYQLANGKIPDYIDAAELAEMGLINRYGDIGNESLVNLALPTAEQELQPPQDDTSVLDKQVEDDLPQPSDLLTHHQVSLVDELISKQARQSDDDNGSSPSALRLRWHEAFPCPMGDALKTAEVHLRIAAGDRLPDDPPTSDQAKHAGKRKAQQPRDTVFECLKCQRTFKLHSQLTVHISTHTKPHQCSHCSARFSTKGNLTVHERSHSGERPFECQHCAMTFATRGNLKRHVRSHGGSKPWACATCAARFTEKKSLNVHMRKHTGQRPYQCGLCSKAFSQSGILKSHMAVHLDQRAYSCIICSRSFRQKSQLSIHEQRHVGLRKYECVQCPAKFLTKGDMTRHHRMHTGERPYACDTCGKTFTRKQSLHEHMNRHNGRKPYECKYCQKSFVEMSACCKHMKSHERAKLDDRKTSSADALTGVDDDPALTEEAGVTDPADREEALCDFAAINLLANASTCQQQQ